ncbi:hypothetical protein L1987_22129 [Smallanthus sonchifolius]|uniref:Uncharacterized protein n=1 Tax=Smallanthus sonchifolius TaxID=185202 RepID=A0ACB9IFG9_9ASTR|nr:hypothetical protein L1987_22129 [Smallanthus sonchifolius]
MSELRVFWLRVVWAMSLLLVAVDCQSTHPTEVTALRVIRENFIDLESRLSNWGLGDPCASNWTGVLCFNTTQDDNYLHVRELLLLNLNLSGTLSPALAQLSYMEILDVMWNQITGSIPKEIGELRSLRLLLLNGNQLTGSLPEEIGNLPNLDRIQIDQNYISGPIPRSFANLNRTMHFHMNNNSLSGQIPPELSRLPFLVHLLLDNNNLSGPLPPELSEMPRLRILQLDNNHFDGIIPPSYGNMFPLLKLSLRNCTLQGPIPDLSRIPDLAFIDLSNNNLNGSIPAMNLSDNITTIDLSRNQLTGTIPPSFSGLPNLQRLSLFNNSLNGSVPSTIWQNRTLNSTVQLTLDMQNNNISGVSGSLILPQYVNLSLQGNPVVKLGRVEGEQMLVYEFMSNGTLRDHLSEKYKESLSFSMRLRIALGSAKGILYLHSEADPPVFHRDIKATNILLDSKLIAKVADFGLSRLAPVADMEGVVPGHVSTVVKGTPGYLDPEYFLTHKLTDKSDVYSLGVVFLELLTGMHPITHGKNIVREVNIAYRSGMMFSVIDAKMGSYPSECVEKFVTLALKCCKEDTDERPSMAEIVWELENIRHMMPESDSQASDYIVTKSGENVSSDQSTSSTTKNPYVSSDISGSDLVSGGVPSIAPR